MPADRSALGAFLRSRRDALTPATAGIAPFPGPRRVPGLRKEELAVLAGLSPDHYSRLEQGRQHTVTDDIVDALSRALRLDEIEDAHLRNLAAPLRRKRSSAWESAQRPDPGLLRVLTIMDHVPALVLGRRSEILACNTLARAVLGAEIDAGAVLVRWLFLDQRARERIVNWSDYASAAVGAMRYEVGRHVADARLTVLVDELRLASGDFARWWNDHGVADRTSVDKKIAHPVVGRLSFGIESLVSPLDPEQRLIIYTVEPESSTARALPMLASWGPASAESMG
ncbi:helix-turn-helix domain-containing protein [Rhodococcus sp. BP-149]|uniref:helix-turn-helix transcriptional regulator n=1 Tax=unclassified Rhodococcus (in: high G+C Gram-positive bacteria) TaxID=192944 RepID=UPI001C9A5FD4|nr:MULTISPECIES: helix-turn-helix transcriptional regulator [unclassified Rhodococcus (in: high G+C Gram-positive bacteria)]MBY6685584.1 helix-turn-helix domain-containing protein [Rhodococcus sp. BP-288]MBY6694868.1 helix-turn-helix domain-containing protein [Rhodococcus sp. BP-188]MBY6696714.1 helix-turn-helix domain-containing protein [Rhodococcus sp. BP-285]MBY6703370.1 helix-turn-helix domain-containing protein [Rhodococcus sp. BP-283]MBY6710676.1 helix-turn-helix domain-containing protei